MSIWKTRQLREDKPWGGVTHHRSPFSMGAKIINLNADCRTSLKYYKNIRQMILLYSGRVMVYAPDEKEFGDKKTDHGNYFELAPGETLCVEAGNPYRISALEDSVLFEVLGGPHPHSRLNEVVMLEDDYGRTPAKFTEKNDD